MRRRVLTPFWKLSRGSPASSCLALVLLFAAPPVPAENFISVSHGRAAPGERGVSIIVTARNDRPLHGYGIALRFPPEAMRLRSIGIDGTHVASADPAFVAPRIDNALGIASLGVILEFGEEATQDPASLPSTVPEDAPRIIARLLFDVPADAPGGTHAVELADGIGQPPAYNSFTHAGERIVPGLRSGTLRVEHRDVVCLESKRAFPGASPNLSVHAFGRHEEPLAGFSLAVLYDCTALTLQDVSWQDSDVGFELGPEGVEFFQTDIDDTVGDGRCRSRTGLIFDYVAPFEGQTLSPSSDGLYDQTLLLYRFGVGPTADDARQWQELVLDQRDGPGVLNNAFVVGASSITPGLIDGKIYFSTGRARGRVVERRGGEPVSDARVVTDPGGLETRTDSEGRFEFAELLPGHYALQIQHPDYYEGFGSELTVSGASSTEDWGEFAIYRIPQAVSQGVFRRGFVNGDGRTDLSDTVWLLNWLFKGGTPPECRLAADVNGDDDNDISDSVYMLNWLFTGGPTPPEPFESCGTDQDSELTCEFTPVCP